MQEVVWNFRDMSTLHAKLPWHMQDAELLQLFALPLCLLQQSNRF
jgi:hypothetical protein